MMYMETSYEWVELDDLGKPMGKAFVGTFPGLRASLLAGAPEGRVAEPKLTAVYIRACVSKVTCLLVRHTTPWSSHRWIPRPPTGPPAQHRHAWLLRL